MVWSMNRKILFLLGSILSMISCTQFLEEDKVAKTTYAGNDGCIYCHTNAERLKVLAVADEDSHGAGGG